MIITRTSLNGKKTPPLSPVGAMKIARNPGFSDRHDEWERFPAPSLRECRSMNGKRKRFLSFVGAMKIARNPGFSGRSGEWYSPSPAPSLRELARPTGVTEGVPFDGSTGPTVYPPVIINSEIFYRLRSSKDTPSVTPFGRDSSLREGAGRGAHHSSGGSLKSQVGGRFSSPLRDSEVGSFYHSVWYWRLSSP